ncbi:MAG: hypothetical protein KGD57_04615 [Candidatus Lokiarchaeota archaeon]|nr:hypothetical protein [Candidatus Lokiarchaeota archaeon]
MSININNKNYGFIDEIKSQDLERSNLNISKIIISFSEFRPNNDQKDYNIKNITHLEILRKEIKF